MIQRIVSAITGKSSAPSSNTPQDDAARLNLKSSSSSPPDDCIDCQIQAQKKNQVPRNDIASSKDEGPCADVYRSVAECMTQNQGQVSKCTKEWAVFQRCHAQHRNAK
uniref:CHCH domain-containing protein n=1 Tax=Craspedostauros australis TaxID=1486917 RepID=A0A7R9ZJG3_9STRA|mmetsp:Transcript_15120/g.41855  ORF Transcript_15120/g.41855 Transcript_15120/m.41855 type:complete len:108 (+) Transcript_15120:239-562(+)